MLRNLWLIVSKPDNVPILGLLVLVIFFAWLAFRLALANDRLRRAGNASGEPADLFYPAEEANFSRKVHAWPYLVRLEMLVAMAVVAVLFVWSITLEAPLEDPANPNVTPNPAKAPWYFLGLQELLVYFDPWIAGVVLPTLIIVGLMAIPYLDNNPRGSGYYTFAERRFEILTFCFGFLVLWVLLIVVGTFLRGPGWMWFWPWQEWDPHRVVAETNRDLTELIGIRSGTPPAFLLGMLAVLGFYAGAGFLSYRWMQRRMAGTLARIGMARFTEAALLFWTMVAVPVKALLRLVLHVKYVWVTPWFNI
jgi:hypothetical protein